MSQACGYLVKQIQADQWRPSETTDSVLQYMATDWVKDIIGSYPEIDGSNLRWFQLQAQQARAEWMRRLLIKE